MAWTYHVGHLWYSLLTCRFCSSRVLSAAQICFGKKSQPLGFCGYSWDIQMDLAVGEIAAQSKHSRHLLRSSLESKLASMDRLHQFFNKKTYTLVNNAFGSRHFLSCVERYNQFPKHCNFHLFAGTELWRRPRKLDPLAPFCGICCTSTVSGIGNEGLKTFKDVTGMAFPIVSSYFASNDACKTSLQVHLY